MKTFIGIIAILLIAPVFSVFMSLITDMELFLDSLIVALYLDGVLVVLTGLILTAMWAFRGKDDEETDKKVISE